VASPGTSFLPEWAPLFSGREVLLCFDCDPAGQAASKKVAALLYPFAQSINIQTGWEGAGHV
jgi:DNA primase